MKIKNIKEKNIKELNIELLNLIREQLNQRMLIASNQLQQTHLLRNVRRNIARLKTVLTEKANS